VAGKPVRLRIVPPPPRILAYHKPVGEIVTHDDPQHRPTVFRQPAAPAARQVQSVGRSTSTPRACCCSPTRVASRIS
jgi:23S rRNA pseudouridine2605 synthase